MSVAPKKALDSRRSGPCNVTTVMPRLSHTVVRIASLLLLLVRCGSDADVPPPGRVHEITRMLALTGTPSTVVLLVVDDAPEAASLRAEMVTVLRQSLARELERWEPGWWRPVDWSIVVAFPSAEGSARWYGPADDIALRLVASEPFGADVIRLTYVPA